MRKVYTAFILLITMLFGALAIGQEQQKSYINYQGVARKADGTLMNGESLTIGVKLKFGSSASETAYEESHSLTTDANGVFSLLIGNGSTVDGDYVNLPWGDFATYATVSINGNEIGTTELMAVPHALSSADNQWHTTGDDIENKNGGNVFVTGSLYASKDLSLAEGAVVNEFSTDITLGGNSDEIVPTQKAVKTYVDSQLGGGGGGADDQTAAEVAYDNTTSGLTASTAQDAIDELVGSGAVDADADPNNEIQDISLSGTELSISDGSTIDLAPIVPLGGTDNQELTFDETTKILEIEDGNTVDLSSLSGGGGSSLWSDNGGDIYYNSGKVGVGVTNPIGKLQISKNSSGAPFVVLESTAGDKSDIRYTKAGSTATWDQTTIIGGEGIGPGTITYSYYDGGTENDIMTINAKGKIGINNPNPESALDVDGTIKSSSFSGGGNVVADANGFLKIGAGGGGVSLWSENGSDIFFDSGKVGVGTNTPESSIAIKTNGNQWNLSTTEGDFRIGDATHRLKMGVAIDGAGAGDARIRVEGGTDRMMLGGGTNDVLTITDQNVGIGTITPAAKLHVDGNIRSNDLSGAGERNVVADANGNLIIGAGGGGSGTPTGLEALDEGSGIGWRLIGRNPDDYGNIGENAIDLAYFNEALPNGGATGDYAFATGENTRAIGDWSTSMGRQNSADGEVSFATGFQNIASGSYSTVMGRETQATGSRSVAMNSETSATGDAATSMGFSTRANGRGSVSMGAETKADAQSTLAIGRFNVGGGHPTNWVGSDPVFEIGNGDGPGVMRANAFTVLKSGWVGIGTPTPTTKLEVIGTIRSSHLAGAGQRNVVADANGDLIIGAGGGGSSLWSENGSDVYYNSGKVGVGTNAPTAHLHISEAAASGSPQLLLEESSTGFSRLRFQNSGKAALWDIAATGADGVSGAGNSALKFHFENDQGTADRMVLTGGGNLGINIPNPLEKLHVGGTVRSADLAGAGQRNVMADANGNLIIGAGGGGSSLWNENGSNIHFNSGNVGIGTNTPTAPLEIKTSNGRPLLIESTSADSFMQYATPAGKIGYSGVWSGNNDVDFGTTLFNNIGKVHLTTKATPRLTVTANGYVGIGGTAPTSRLHIFQGGGDAPGNGLRFSRNGSADWEILQDDELLFLNGNIVKGMINPSTGAYVQTSDQRMKENIKSLDPILDKVVRLRPATYNYKSDSKKKNTMGLIAQEVQLIFPELVNITGEEKMLGLDYGAFSVVAIKAIQEQQSIIDKQSEKIAGLEERLNKLEAKTGN